MDKPQQYTFSELLRQFRVREGFNQQELADRLHVHRNTVVAWEKGDSLPKTRTKVQELTDALYLTEADAMKLLRAGFWEPSSVERREDVEPPTKTRDALSARSLFWKLPYRRNPYFTGREHILKKLHETLASGGKAALTQMQAISGLGGIGKTQTAVEYAYRYQKDYQTVLWARADTAEALVADFVDIAGLLKLPEKEEGANFLLRRMKLIAPDAPLDDVSHQDWTNAKAIADTLDGLPLALDQAGAYIEETACGLSGYLKRYEKHHQILLKRRGDITSYDHPESVATTWSLSFDKVGRANVAAAELLQFCAFLHPDAIPEEIISEGASELGPILEPLAANLIELDTAIGVLRGTRTSKCGPKPE